MKKIALIIGLLIAFLLCGIVSAEIGGDGKEHDPSAVIVSVRSFSVAQPQEVNCKILWDITHGDSGTDGFAKYGELVSDLQNAGCSVTTTSAGVDTPGLLSQYDVLVISAGSSANSAYTVSEANAIETFVNNGGGLLVMDEWLGFNAANVEPVVERFGTSAIASITTWDQVTNLASHPIFSGITTIKLFFMGSLGAQSPSTAVAWYGQDAVVNVVTGKKVVIIGDGNIFQTDATNDFINQNDNRQFAANVFAYLCPHEGIPTPEFPTIFLPATMIIGFLGDFLFIQRTKQQ